MTVPASTDIRARLVETLRRDLIGPGPQDADLARERLKEKPSGWYVTGYLAPVPEPSGPSAHVPEEDLFAVSCAPAIPFARIMIARPPPTAAASMAPPAMAV